MVDQVTIRRPGETDDEATWNDDLGRYESNSVEPGKKIYQGKAVVSSKGWTPRDETSGGQTTTESSYSVSIPLGTPELKEDDIIIVDSCVRDPHLSKKRFITKAPVYTTYAVQQKVLVELWDGKRPR